MEFRSLGFSLPPTDLELGLLDALDTGDLNRVEKAWKKYLPPKGAKEPSLALGSRYMSLCALKADRRRAARLAEELTSRGVKLGVETHSALVAAYARAGFPDKAEKICEEMASKGYKPNARSYTPILSAYNAQNRWHDALSALRRMERAAVMPTSISYDAVLGGISEAGAWRLGIKILREMESGGKRIAPSNFTYGMVARILAEREDWVGGLMILQHMRQRNLTADRVTYSGVMHSLGVHGKWKHVTEIFAKLNTSADHFVCGAALKALCLCKKWELALDYMKDFCTKGLPCGELLSTAKLGEGDKEYSNQIMFNTVLDGIARHGPSSAVLRVLHLMQGHGVTKSTVTYNTLLNAFGVQREWEKAEQVVEAMSRSNVKPDIYTFNSMMKAYRLSGAYERMMELLDQMHAYESTWARDFQGTAIITATDLQIKRRRQLDALWGIEGEEDRILADAYTYAEAIKACITAGKPRLGLRMFDSCVISTRLPPDGSRHLNQTSRVDVTNVLIGAALDCCAKTGDWAKALRLSKLAEARGIRPSVISVTALVSSCAKGGQWQLAMKMVIDMEERGIRTNEVTYHTLLASLGRTHSLPWFQGDFLLHRMQHRRLSPDDRTYHILLAGYHRARQWQAVVDIVHRMRARGYQVQENLKEIADAARTHTRNIATARSHSRGRGTRQIGVASAREEKSELRRRRRVGQRQDQRRDKGLEAKMEASTENDTSQLATDVESESLDAIEVELGIDEETMVDSPAAAAAAAAATAAATASVIFDSFPTPLLRRNGPAASGGKRVEKWGQSAGANGSPGINGSGHRPATNGSGRGSARGGVNGHREPGQTIEALRGRVSIARSAPGETGHGILRTEEFSSGKATGRRDAQESKPEACTSTDPTRVRV